MKNIAASFALASALYLLPAVSHSAKAQGFGSGFADSFAAGGALVTQDQSARQERAQYRRPTLTSGEQFAFNLLKVGIYGCFGLIPAALVIGAYKEIQKKPVAPQLDSKSGNRNRITPLNPT